MNTMKTIIYFLSLFLSLFLLAYSTVIGQTSDVANRELQVEKKYNTEIYSVEPIFDFASISTPKRRSISFLNDTLLGISPYAPSIDIKVRPVAYKNAEETNQHKAFIKLDKGTINLWHGQGGYVYSASNYFNITANAEYDRWQSNEIEDKNINTINGNIGMTYYLTSALKTSLLLDYKKHDYGKYGGQQIGQEPTNLTSSYDQVDVKFNISSFNTNPSKWNYGLDVRFLKWNNLNEDMNEVNIDILPDLQYQVSSSIRLQVNPMVFLSNSQQTGNTTILGSDLTASINTPNTFLIIGGSAKHINGSWHVWPKTRLKWNLLPNHSIHLLSDLSTTPVNASIISSFNPYIKSTSLFSQTPFHPEFKNVTVIKRAGINYNGKILADLSLFIKSRYEWHTDDINIQVIEDDITNFNFSLVNYNLLSNEVAIEKSFLENQFTSSLGINYNFYINPTETLWHRPNLYITADLGFTPMDGLDFSLAGRFNSPQSFSTSSQDSGWKANVSIEGRYDVFEQVSIYLNADNVFDNKYLIWNTYPSFGRNLSAGILVKL